MSEVRFRPDIVVAAILATVFFVIAGAMQAPATIEALSGSSEINVFYQPYLNVMAALAGVNALLILAMVPIHRRASGWWAKVPLWITVALSTFILSEVGALVILKKLYDVPHVGSRYTHAFLYGPSLGIVPKPNFRIQLAGGELTHTAGGYRGPEPPPKTSDDQQTFVTIGGSSTYDIALPDDQTWPTDLGRIFADQIRILNLGIPGHSTAEHITLASQVAWKYHPDVIIYYIGWNDIRSSHVDESTNFARFHKRRLFYNFGLTETPSFFALGYIVKSVLARLDGTSLYNLAMVETEPGADASVDERLLEIYRHNVRMLAAITREIGAKPVFVPQIMNVHRLTSEQPYEWIPRIPQRAVPKVLAAFNDAMMETARSVDATVIPEVLDVDWQDADFVDRGHFSERGAQRFACVVGMALIDRGVVHPSPAATAASHTYCDPSSN
jgi:lysophospholipase L1-like esterase